MFQYKIIHDILSVNYTLYKWKVQYSDRCSYCFLQKDTVKHLFVECTIAITFYKNVQNWAKSFNIILPELNTCNVLFGITSWNKNNSLANHFLIVYKQILFYHREKGRYYNSLPHFINRLIAVHLERVIGKSKHNDMTKKHDKNRNNFLVNVIYTYTTFMFYVCMYVVHVIELIYAVCCCKFKKGKGNSALELIVYPLLLLLLLLFCFCCCPVASDSLIWILI